jgi:IS30 family transposase
MLPPLKREGDSIDNRPKEVDDRSPLHWEADCVLSGRCGHSCLLVLIERYSLNLYSKCRHTQACVIDVLNTYKSARQIFRKITRGLALGI